VPIFANNMKNNIKVISSPEVQVLSSKTAPLKEATISGWYTVGAAGVGSGSHSSYSKWLL
jgi:hypothetical protein